MKRMVLLLGLVGFVASAFAKENPSLALEVGAIGYEKEDTYYTHYVFNPDVHADVVFPVFNVKENVQFGIKAGYDFSVETYEYGTTLLSTSSSSSSSKIMRKEMQIFTHTISLLPEFIFAKNDLRMGIASGIGLAFNKCKYTNDYENEYSYTSTYTGDYSGRTSENIYSDDQTLFQLFWVTDLGLTYKLTDHFSLIGDFVISVAMYTQEPETMQETNSSTTITYNEATTTIIGRYPLYFSPRIGVRYMF